MPVAQVTTLKPRQTGNRHQGDAVQLHIYFHAGEVSSINVPLSAAKASVKVTKCARFLRQLEEMFSNAYNFVVNGGQFTTFNISADQDSVSTILWGQVAAGAMFDSVERCSVAKCHPGTRQKMIENVMKWIDGPNSAQRVLWLYGPAGSGKSALAHSICELLGNSRPENYGGSFFFARGLTDRGNGFKLFTTLSYQLALQNPTMRAEINKTLLHDPSLPTKSMEIQLLSLVIQPLLKCQSLSPHMPTVIIDGLDECADDDGLDIQRHIVTLIAKSVVEYNLPLRFLIASRPEPWIRDAFETTPLPSITIPLALRDDMHVDKDIKGYFAEGFEKIRTENKRVMGSTKPPWPPTDVIDHFVYEASGQYIYASTILKFVGKHSKFTNPEEQLRIITSPGPHRALAFSELDRLYATILSAYPRQRTMKRVLGGLLVDANLTTIQVAFNVDHAELILCLDGLSSVIDIKESRELSYYELLLEPVFGSLSAAARTASFCHLSFREYLEDETRSGPFHIRINDVGNEITKAFFRVNLGNLGQSYEMEPHLSLDIDLIAYHRMMSDLITYTKEHFQIDTILPLITNTTQKLLFSVDCDRMNHPGCFLQDLEYLESLSTGIKFKLDRTSPLPDTLERQKIIRSGIQELQNAVSLAQNDGIRALSSHNRYRISPTFVYIKLFSDCDGTTAKKLFTIPGNTIADTVSTLRQYCHILNLDDLDGAWSVQLLDRLTFMNPTDNVHDGWPSLAEWRDQRVSLTYHCLKSIMDSVDNDWEHTDVDVKFRHTFIKSIVFADFFDDNEAVWDTRTKESFENPHNLALLNLMVDSTAWTRFMPLRSESRLELENVIGPVLCWFNRQLINPQIIGLMKNHDETLPQKMAMTMREIFYHCFVRPNFMAPYYDELQVPMFIDDKWHTKWVKIRVRPLPQPVIYWEEDIHPYSPFGDRDILRVHRELFGKASISAMEAPNQYLIERSDWYPYFATHLLNSLVRCLYCRTAQTYLRSDYDYVASSFQLYIIECLPYAQTTQQNLDALRAAVFFSQKEASPWRPPIGFCSLTRQFLQKYNCSVLYPEELRLFERWLTNLQQLEVDSSRDELLTISCI